MMNTKILLKTISSNRSVFFSNCHSICHSIIRIAMKFTQRNNLKKENFHIHPELLASRKLFCYCEKIALRRIFCVKHVTKLLLIITN